MALSFEEATKPFVAEVRACSLEQALEKFSGRRTVKTVVAANRIAGRNRRVTIPAHFLRQLWSLTGGWEAPIKANWPTHNHPVKPAEFVGIFSGVRIYNNPNDGSVLFKVGDLKVAHLPKGKSWPYRVWNHEENAKAALAALATINK